MGTLLSGINFYLSLTALLSSLGLGIYFFFLWFESNRKHAFLLWWALGFGVLLLFKIPNILTNGGINIIQTDFYPFFYLTVLLSIISHCAFARGISQVTHLPTGKFAMWFFALLLSVAAVYFYLTFFVKGFEITYAPAWAGHVLFFIPIQLFMLSKLWRAVRDLQISRTGIIFSALGILSLFVSSLLYIAVQVYPYPRWYWYSSVVNSSAIPIVQILALFFLFFGFHGFLARAKKEHS